MSLLSLGLAHAGGSEVGSPLYRVPAHHAGGLLAAALVPIALWVVRWRAKRGGTRAFALLDGYRRLPLHHRVLACLLLLTAAVHLGLVVREEELILKLLFVLYGLALTEVARRLALGRRFRLRAAVLLLGSVLAYAVAGVVDEPPDQVGIATKLVELAALGIVLRPTRPTRLRRLSASFATVSLLVVAGLATWIGAFVAASRSGGEGHHGAVPMPGFVFTPQEKRAPTPAQRSAAARFYRQADHALRRYRDPAAAATDGYQVSGIAGNDFHAHNPGYAADGLIFAPGRPENLVYAETARGPLLLGAMYELPKIGQRGPAIGGPLTEWHAHERVCLALTPPAFAGLESPFGDCPFVSVTIPITPEVIHLWLVPGAPWFGDLTDGRRAAYIAAFEAHRSRPTRGGSGTSHPVTRFSPDRRPSARGAAGGLPRRRSRSRRELTGLLLQTPPRGGALGWLLQSTGGGVHVVS